MSRGMPEKSKIFETLKELLNERSMAFVDMTKITAESKIDEDSLLNTLNFDSLDAVEFIMAIEDRFDISIDDSEMNNLTTIQSLVDIIDRKR